MIYYMAIIIADAFGRSRVSQLEVSCTTMGGPNTFFSRRPAPPPPPPPPPP
eukprot:COSAG01_NODE_11527_length_1914_cov_1.161433_1_plen_50_part_10